MISDFRDALKKDTRLKLIFFGGLLVQLLFAVTSVGYHFPDQHFQIIEFSSAQSGEPSGSHFVWEWTNHIRPTVQVYLFTGLHQLLTMIGVSNPFTEMIILRILLCIPMFLLFNLLTYTFLKDETKKILFAALILLNFSWFLPYLRTQYSSEMVSSLFFFGTALLYHWKKDTHPGIVFLILVGILFGFTFYIRFQSLFFLAGFGIWLIWVHKAIHHAVPLLAGFIIGCAINVLLDSLFYKELIFTPYTYFHANIIEGYAASMGTKSFLFYIGIIVAHTAAPFLNLILLYYGIKAYRKKYSHLVFITVALFLIGHSFVGHKEDRFLFPVFNVLPVILGFGLAGFLQYYETCKKWIRVFLKGLILFSVVLNFILLTIFAFTPWCQNIQFLQNLYNKVGKNATRVKIYYVKKPPFGNPEKASFVYYKKAFTNIETIELVNIDSLQHVSGPEVYLAATFNDIKNDRALINSSGFKPVMYSSQLLWNVNEFLFSKRLQGINEIWVLYKK